jgi:hypothetical protein
VWFTWLESEEEGALLSINDLVNVVRNANTKELKALKIIRDKCQQTAYNKFKIGDKSLTYIHIACGDLMENTEIPFETNTSKNIDWNAKLDANAIYIDPSEVSKVSTVIKDGTKYVRYQFHELKYSEKPFELPQLTENVLFHFLVLESEAADFEEYLYPKDDIILANVEWYDQTNSLIDGVKNTSGYGNCTYCSSWSTCKKELKNKCCNTCCRVACQYIVRTSGATIGTSSNVCILAGDQLTVENSQNYSIIDKNLKKGFPVIVGVNISNEDASTNNNSATNHYIVIIGRHYDNTGNKSYYFHEVGTTHSNIGDGRNKNNILTFDKNDNLFKGEKPYLNDDGSIIYTITEIYSNN